MIEIVGFLVWVVEKYKDGIIPLQTVQMVGCEVLGYLRTSNQTAKMEVK